MTRTRIDDSGEDKDGDSDGSKSDLVKSEDDGGESGHRASWAAGGDDKRGAHLWRRWC
jgi:hypothetical protein